MFENLKDTILNISQSTTAFLLLASVVLSILDSVNPSLQTFLVLGGWTRDPLSRIQSVPHSTFIGWFWKHCHSRSCSVTRKGYKSNHWATQKFSFLSRWLDVHQSPCNFRIWMAPFYYKLGSREKGRYSCHWNLLS